MQNLKLNNQASNYNNQINTNRQLTNNQTKSYLDLDNGLLGIGYYLVFACLPQAGNLVIGDLTFCI